MGQARFRGGRCVVVFGGVGCKLRGKNEMQLEVGVTAASEGRCVARRCAAQRLIGLNASATSRQAINHLSSRQAGILDTKSCQVYVHIILAPFTRPISPQPAHTGSTAHGRPKKQPQAPIMDDVTDKSKAVQALLESRPPATDNFTYLTIIEKFLSPEILPTLNEILQDASLTQEIGWDLVQNLLLYPEGDKCLETIARLGNPREVIIKLLEVLEGHPEDDDDASQISDKDASDADPEAIRRFIVLLGMLAILHRRIKTKYPSRFLATTLATVQRAYRPNQLMTASAINLVQSLSGHRRPPLPSRKSSVNVANPDKDGDVSKNAPDPEAEQHEDPAETEIQERLLLSFVLGILESYVNATSPAWAQRLIEAYNPGKTVPGKKTALQAYKDDSDLLARDAIIGQLAALSQDLGISGSPAQIISSVCEDGPIRRSTIPDADRLRGPQDVHLPTGGAVCLMGYWVFSSTVFQANMPKPKIYILPEHLGLMQRYLEDDANGEIQRMPGTIEAILAIGLWLEHGKFIVAPTMSTETLRAAFMPYHHLLTLCSVYHPSLGVRNAASTLAGLILHACPEEDGRLHILEDLLENCMFSNLKACAVTWLKEELEMAQKPPAVHITPASGLGIDGAAVSSSEDKTSKTSSSIFGTPEAIEQLQYLVFPDMQFVREMDKDAFAEYWSQNSPFLMQAANFAYLLFRSERYRKQIPEGMRGAMEERFIRPLISATSKPSPGQSDDKSEIDDHSDPSFAMELDVLNGRLKDLTVGS
ncbi:hypothetical protein PoMZ_00404 [Pyricularia oryzae]|nr:hypothetical protein PoMZ_00404 [Pyricularia oryzae]